MENNDNSTANCTITVAMAKNTLTVYVAFSIVATFCYCTSVFIIVKTQAYRQFVHRLTLYLCLIGLFQAVALLLEVIPIDIDQPDTNTVSVRRGWEGACVFGGAIAQYVGFVQTMAIFWICLYIFVVVVLSSQRLRQRKLEVIGVVLIVFVPVLLTWEPFVTSPQSYGISGTHCWIKDTCAEDSLLAHVYNISIVLVPRILLTFSGFLLMMLALLTLAKRVWQKILNQRLHWLAMKDILPLAPYPLLYSLIWLVRILATRNNLSVFVEITVALVQTSSFVLPLSLIVRSRVRNKLGCRCCWSAGNKREDEKEQLRVTDASDYSSHA